MSSNNSTHAWGLCVWSLHTNTLRTDGQNDLDKRLQLSNCCNQIALNEKMPIKCAISAADL